MPAPTNPGDPIKARLSAKYDPDRGGSLTAAQASLARHVIKRLRRTDTKGRGAKGRVLIPGAGRVGVFVDDGKVGVNFGQGWRTGTHEKKTASVADAVCGAVAAGLFRPDGQGDGQAPSGDATGDAGGQAQDGQAQDGQGDAGAGENGQDGDGQGEDGDGEDGDGDSADGEPGEDGQGSGASQSSAAENPEDTLDYLKRRLDEIQAYCRGAADEIQGDGVSNVPFKYGARMLARGIPVRAILHAWAITWTPTARAAAGIEDYDPATFGTAPDGAHPLYPYIRALIEADVPVYLKGPSQAGKSYVLEQIAVDLSLPFRACPLTGGASTTWLLGGVAPPPIGVIEAGFPECYAGVPGEHDGGVFLFDEVDAGDPNMTIVLNNALANGTLENTKLGRVYQRGSHFRPVAAGNTWGKGATSDFGGRQRQDKALLERFRVGRVDYGYDRDLQHAIADRAYERAVACGGNTLAPLAGEQASNGNGAGLNSRSLAEAFASLTEGE